MKDEEIKRLRLELEFYKGALNALQNPVFLKDEQLQYVFFNESYKKFFKLSEGQYIGMKVTDLPYLSAEDRERYQKEDTEMLANQSVIQYETNFEDPDEGLRESLYWSKGFSVGSTGQRGVIGEIVDIAAEKHLQRELKRHVATLEELMEETKQTSQIDPSTNLYNRHAFKELPDIIEKSKRDGNDVCALMTDIDNFKGINDTYGHLAGDEILMAFADVMRKSFRKNDMLIRYGGDEFTAILIGVSRDSAKTIAERFLENVRKEVLLPNGNSVTISIGVSQMQPDDDVMQFIARTDEALYKAKKTGKNKVVVDERR